MSFGGEAQNGKGREFHCVPPLTFRRHISKHLHAMVVGIRHINPVVAVDEQSRGQLEFRRPIAALPEVIKEPSFLIEGLHRIEHAVDDVEVPLGVRAHTFRAEHRSIRFANLSDAVQELACAVEHLHAKIHRIDHDQLIGAQAKFGREVELANVDSTLANRLQDVAFHVEDENLVAQRVADKDPSPPESTAMPVGRL